MGKLVKKVDAMDMRIFKQEKEQTKMLISIEETLKNIVESAKVKDDLEADEVGHTSTDDNPQIQSTNNEESQDLEHDVN
jgi:hypothetical protein